MPVRDYFERRRAARDMAREIRHGQETFDMLMQQPGTNNPEIFEMSKLLGIFILEPQQLFIDHQDPTSGRRLRRGDPYLDITILPLGKNQVDLEYLHRSHELTAAYVALNGLHAYTNMAAVGAYTNHRFAKVAERALGFNVIDADDPSAFPGRYYQSQKEIYDRFVKGPKGADFQMSFVYQTPEQLLGHFATTNEEIGRLMRQPNPKRYSFIPGFGEPPRQQ